MLQFCLRVVWCWRIEWELCMPDDLILSNAKWNCRQPKNFSQKYTGALVIIFFSKVSRKRKTNHSDMIGMYKVSRWTKWNILQKKMFSVTECFCDKIFFYKMFLGQNVLYNRMFFVRECSVCQNIQDVSPVKRLSIRLEQQ